MNEFTIHTLMEKVRETGKNYNEQKIIDAYELADSAHKGQKRKSGEPFICHPIAVAFILLELFMDTDTLVAALLHDVVEDTDISLDELQRRFGSDVAALVDGVTKIKKVKMKFSENSSGKRLKISTEEELKNENIRKILFAMSKDSRVIILKLADRLHNMRTLNAFTSEKCIRIAHESMSIYAPLAHRLGIAHIKDEMQNLSLLYLDKPAYEEIEEDLKRHSEERGFLIETVTEKISARLSDMSPRPIIEGRVKGIYSLYKKMYLGEKVRGLGEIFDLYAVRVIVNSVVDCYNALGVIHDMFTVLPGRFKDYISTPKINGYQSLHTVVLGKEKQAFEVQIRTHEMHTTARFGIAAHWKYKAGLSSKNPLESKFDFIRKLLEQQQQQADDADHFERIIRNNFEGDDVEVFTPQGDVKHLPKKSTVIDFAYSVHTQIGNKMTGAKIHGKKVGLSHVLSTGDVVEIELSDSPDYGPNRSWLGYVKTNEAKSKIRYWLKHNRKEENVSSGRAYVNSMISRLGIQATDETLTVLAENHRFHNLDAFYAAIGYGRISTEDAALWIEDEFKAELDKKSNRPPVNPYSENSTENYIGKNQAKPTGVIVEKNPNCRTKFANCCSPLPGDEIIGFVTKGYGVSIHKKRCPNIAYRMRLEEDKERVVAVRWPDDAHTLYTATIEVVANDLSGMLMSLTATISKDHNVRITGSNSSIIKSGNAVFSFTIEVASVTQLETLMKTLKQIAGVISVKRINNSQ
ncbi:MAG: bifunctional (p)ppGpp synthetase/guanosine-3',5'-bis(diphosphate) 3'-pyrophosphohydrolase [Oscillospiraceae bacterium]|nr:bifunctional (p)ppGpp synthetase/guanosine-3',5'-bis(diphosphate) 3'-pyrophosphohydrolase [Oscillospiraceae bacterium]